MAAARSRGRALVPRRCAMQALADSALIARVLDLSDEAGLELSLEQLQRELSFDLLVQAHARQRAEPGLRLSAKELERLKLLSLREYVRGPEPFYTRNVFTQLEELELTTLLDAIVSAHPDVEVGSYPKWFDPTYKTKITLDARSEAAVEAALAALLAGMPKTGVG